MSSYRLRRQSSSHSQQHHHHDERRRSVKFKTDLQKQSLLNCCVEREWMLTDLEDDWNVYWATVGRIRRIFSLESGIRLRDDQILNHFPNHYELTRKDLMVKNLKRYKKYLEKNNNNDHDSNINFVPSSYILPADYPIFEEEFKKEIIGHTNKSNFNFNHKQRGSKWILKPSSRAQGNGIFIINRLSQLKKWTNSNKYSSSETYVISKYIEKPLLIGGRKFDLRLFALITSYRPLKIYFYKNGFARFSNVKYTTERDQMNNSEVHLTNVAIQKHGSDYNPNHGNKWSFDNVLLYIQGNFGNESADILLSQIKNIIICSALSVRNVMINDKHCFECYGYDIIIDEHLKPWLIEINSSPSLSATTKNDRIFKKKLIYDLFKIIVPNDFPSTKTTNGSTNWCNEKQIGDFYLLYSEEKQNNEQNNNNDNEDEYNQYHHHDINDQNNFNYNNNNNNTRYTNKRKLRSNWR